MNKTTWVTETQCQSVVRRVQKIADRASEGLQWHADYLPCDSIPADVRMDIDRRTAGNMVQVSYGGWDRAEHGYGDPYMQVVDYSDSPRRPKTYQWTTRPHITASVGCTSGMMVAIDIDLGDFGRVRLPPMLAIGDVEEAAVNSAVAELNREWNEQFSQQVA